MATDLRIIDTDTHIIEPPDAWTSRMSAKKWGDLVPHVRWDAGHTKQSWYVGETRITDVGSSVVVPGDGGRPARWRGNPVSLPAQFEQMHPSAYDAAARVKVMDEDGIRAAVLYPNVGLFFTPQMHQCVNVDLDQYRLDCVRAYNDFTRDWISSDPSRFVILASIPYWDVEASVAEIERCAPLGFKGIVTTGVPQAHGQPYLADRHWDPLWAAAQAHNMSVSFHVGGGDVSEVFKPERIAVEGIRTTCARATVDIFFDNALTLTDLLLSGILPRFPDLKFVIVESGIGWIPFCLEAVDYHFAQAYGVREERPEFEMLPSEYFHRQVFANYWFEELVPLHLERIGAGNILFETDFPHPTSLFGPDVKQAIDHGLGAVDDATREAILWRNAAELYGLTGE